VFQVRNQIVQKWIVQRNSPILFWGFRGVIGSGSLSTWAYYQIYQKIWLYDILEAIKESKTVIEMLRAERQDESV
jgi:hypothetical protein